jgi:hypothetical protein
VPTTTHIPEDLADLADQLRCEYAGALAPEDILALVFRANHMVSSQPNLTADARLATVKAVARRLLTERLALMSRERPPLPIV